MTSLSANEPDTNAKILLITTCGDIDIYLWGKECPLATRNFIQHCLNGYYDGTIFHRLSPKFIIQGGDPTGTGEGGEAANGEPFKDEPNQRLRFNRRGLLAMANGGKHQNKSQFFLTLDATPDLQGKHTLFGKVEGDTIYNLLKLGEGETDGDERPVRIQKIIKAQVVVNPFADVVKREKVEKELKELPIVAKKKVKNTKLLSFGDEVDEDDGAATLFSGNKGKSVHDLLDDERLSKVEAIDRKHLEKGEVVINEGGFKKKKSKKKKDAGETKIDEDVDMEKIAQTDQEEAATAKLSELQNELLKQKKEFKKSLRVAKEEEMMEEAKPDAVKKFHSARLTFKSKTASVVKSTDKRREQQTMEMLASFSGHVAEEISKGVGKAMIEESMHVDSNLIERIQMPNCDFDAEDLPESEWLTEEFVAPEPDPTVTRAKDANMKDIAEDWYDISDPRNQMNIRKRGN
uniref:PPIase cyclophilin-type domain-containing protein n=1 Tax=Rhabditophanes sp. KR3021 TaxID=114890 RepID=A0AC35UCK0_9BILA